MTDLSGTVPLPAIDGSATYSLLLASHGTGCDPAPLLRGHAVMVGKAEAAAPVLAAAALRDIVGERIAQIETHGFTLEHDLGHHPGNLALAAASYLTAALNQLHRLGEPLHMAGPATWPWANSQWKPGDARENLIKAIAIAWATVDRIDAALSDSAEALDA